MFCLSLPPATPTYPPLINAHALHLLHALRAPPTLNHCQIIELFMVLDIPSICSCSHLTFSSQPHALFSGFDLTPYLKDLPLCLLLVWFYSAYLTLVTTIIFALQILDYGLKFGFFFGSLTPHAWPLLRLLDLDPGLPRCSQN